jgi:hypothetical protein
VELNATRLFVGFGALMIMLTLIFLLNPAVRSMESVAKEESYAITP